MRLFSKTKREVNEMRKDKEMEEEDDENIESEDDEEEMEKTTKKVQPQTSPQQTPVQTQLTVNEILDAAEGNLLRALALIRALK